MYKPYYTLLVYNKFLMENFTKYDLSNLFVCLFIYLTIHK